MIDCDFIPATYHDRRKLQAAVRLRAGCIVALCFIMGVWFMVNERRIASAEAMLVDVELQQDQVRVHTIKRTQMSTEKARLNGRRRLIDQLSDRASLVVVLSDLSRRLPETVVVTHLTVDSPSVSAFAETPKPVVENKDRLLAGRFGSPPPVAAESRPEPVSLLPELELVGIAVSLPDAISLAARLEESPLFREVDIKVQGSTVWNGRRAEQFKLTAILTPHAGERP